MIKHRWIIFVLLSLSSILVLTACNNKKSVSDDALPFVIGGMGPTSGEFEEYGKSLKQGAELAIKDINNKGGIEIDGKEYKLVFEFANDENDKEFAKYAYDKLKSSGAGVIIGPINNDIGKTVCELANNDKKIMVLPTLDVNDANSLNNTFRMCLSEAKQGKIMAEYAYNTAKKTKAAIICSVTDHEKNISEAFITRYEELGGTVVLCENYDNQSDSDKKHNIRTGIESVNNSDAGILFAPVEASDAGIICNMIDELGKKYDVIGCDGWSTINSIVDDNTITEGIVFLSQFVVNNEENVISFRKKYQEEYFCEPDMYAANAYDSVYAVFEAAKLANSLEYKKMIGALYSIEFDGITGDNISFDNSGDTLKRIHLNRVRNGKFMCIE